MLRLCGPRPLPALPPGGGWVYLGKSAAERGALAALLGPPTPLGERLHEEARALRGPFLDLVGTLGRGRRGDAAWWAGTLAWKAWGSSDLFLLVCYLGLCRRLAGEPRPLGAADITVVVEDPWVLAQAREAFAGTAGVSFSGRAGLTSSRLGALAWGLARRAKWLARTLRSRGALRAAGARADAPRAGAVAVYTHPVARAFRPDGGFADPFLPGLDAELAAAGLDVVRLTYPDATGFEAELAGRGKLFTPLALWGRAGDLAAALAAVPPRVPAAEAVAGLPVGLLLKREWWHDLSRAGRAAFLFHHACARRFFAAARPRALVMPWEAQPQERLLVLAAREAGLRSAGYQHTTVPEFQLPFFLGAGEAGDAPLPDALLTSGRHPLRALADGGVPAGILVDGGSRRYQHYLAERPWPSRPASGDVLIILPVERDQARHLLAALGAAYPEGGAGFRFHLRAHPSDPAAAGRAAFPVERADGPLDEAFARCGTVVFCGSTAGLDAVLAGRAALRYRSETLVDFDPCGMLGEDVFPTASDAALRERLESLRRTPLTAAPPSLPRTLADLFSPVDPAAWLKAVGGPAAGGPAAGGPSRL